MIQYSRYINPYLHKFLSLGRKGLRRVESNRQRSGVLLLDQRVHHKDGRRLEILQIVVEAVGDDEAVAKVWNLSDLPTIGILR